MPKETFYNLPKTKREKIEEAAIQEFKQYSFDASSINRIVESSEISKGSFYQYFEDKKDLYKHIMSMIVEKKLEYMSPTMINPLEYDFFTLLRELYKSGLSFGKENPEFLEIGNKLLADTSNPIFEEIMVDNKEKSDQVFQHLISNAVKRGEIRKGLDLRLISYLITNLNIAISDYYMKDLSATEGSEDMMNLIDKFIDFVQYGIAERGMEDD